MIPPPRREPLDTGIIHFGPGAFHRAHQADYIDRLNDRDPNWGISAVSLRTAGTIDSLRRQDGAYTLAILDEETSFRTIRVHNRFFGPQDATALQKQFLDPNIRVISSTVTEKGYCLAPDGTLDFDHPDVRHDVEHPAEPRSLVGWLSLALSIRRAEDLPPLTVICCDNMTSNGRKVAAAVRDFAGKLNPEIDRWIGGEVRFPNTMVDSITPATDDALRDLVRERTGWADEIPVRREAYAEWVIEDILPGGVPDLASVGATITSDVGGWEKAKLRILNGSHSALAYIGLLLGHETVADAVADADLFAFVERMVSDDIIPTLQPSPLNLTSYARETFARFRNPAIHHKLSQIAWDGSQKLPYRLLDTAVEALDSGASVERLGVPIAAWIAFLERQSRLAVEIVDPLADRLTAAATSGDSVRSILSIEQVFPRRLGPGTQFGEAVAAAHGTLVQKGPAELLKQAVNEH